jgi:hypothetical protein
MCVIYTVHEETRNTSFLIEPQNQGRRFISGLASKPLGQFYPIWPQNRWRWFSPVSPQNRWQQFLPIWYQTGGGGFPGLGLKTGSFGLVIWASKSPWRFLSLGLKTKWVMICRLRLKTDRRMESVWGTRQNLVACFTWKQVGLGFPSLNQNWWRRDGGWCTWHHRGDCIEIKLKTDGSMWRITSDSATLTLSFSLY